MSLGDGLFGLIWSVSAHATDVSGVVSAVAPSVGACVATAPGGAETWAGSAFAIGDGTVLATNFHVAGAAGAMVCEFGLGGRDVRVVEGMIAMDEKADLALLRIRVPVPPLVLAETVPGVGTEVVALGNSQALGTVAATGIVSGIMPDAANGRLLVRHTAATSSGNSGGPVVDLAGNVVGVNTMVVVDAQNLNFAVSAVAVQALLARVESAEARKELLQATVAPDSTAAPAPSAVKLVDRGWKQVNVGKYQDAALSFSLAMDIDPQHPDANLGYGYVMLKLGKPEEATTYLCGVSGMSGPSGSEARGLVASNGLRCR